jgi:hypothetical protein
VIYHLFSDNKDRIENIFRHKRYVIHDDNPSCDWVGMYVARNIIQSNSTFCWTASLYNKLNSVQPACGYNYNYNNGDVPCGFIMPFSDVIDVNGKIIPKTQTA